MSWVSIEEYRKLMAERDVLRAKLDEAINEKQMIRNKLIETEAKLDIAIEAMEKARPNISLSNPARKYIEDALEKIKEA